MRKLMVLVLLVFAVALVFAVPVSAGENTNSVAYWCGSENLGTKIEPVSTPYVLNFQPPEGYTFTDLIVKAGSGDGENEKYAAVFGNSYSHSSGKDNSHVIVCWEEGTTTTTEETTTTTDPEDTTTTTDPEDTTTTSEGEETTTTGGETTTTTRGTTTRATRPDPGGNLPENGSGGDGDAALLATILAGFAILIGGTYAYGYTVRRRS